MIRNVAAILFFIAALPLYCDACENGEYRDLVKFWHSFRETSLRGTPDQISKFYFFPLHMGGVQEGDKPIPVSKKTFLEHYDVLFRIGMSGEERYVYRLLKDSTDEDLTRPGLLQRFDRNGCSVVVKSATSISAYNLIWTKKDGWKINSVEYAEDYDDLISTYDFWGINR